MGNTTIHEQERKSSNTTNAQTSPGAKRTASKVAPTESKDSDGEPETKKIREDETTDMNDVQNLTTEVYEFYSVPRIAPRTLGKYVKKSMSFDINVVDENGCRWDFT